MPYKTMEKGFFESGLMLNNLIRYNYVNLFYFGLGGGIFMRYGAYADPIIGNDLAYKVSLVITY
jgi:hypothetical protein